MLFLLLLNLNVAKAISISPAQIMIPSNLISEENKEIIIFLELEKSESTRKINFEIPNQYQKQVRIDKSSLTITNKGKITLTLKNLKNLEPGEHNIDINLLENKETIKNSLNNMISIKVIVPENIPINNNNTTLKKEENEFTTFFIIIAIALCITIIILTTFLLKHLNLIKKEKNNLILNTLHAKTKLQEMKIDNMIDNTNKILQYLKNN